MINAQQSLVLHTTIGEKMSKRKKRYKRRRMIILAIAMLLVVLFIVKFKAGSQKQKNNGPNEPGGNEMASNEKEDSKSNDGNNEIVELVVSPNVYNAFSGEVIGADKFKLNAKLKTGETKEIKDGITFTADSSILKIESASAKVVDDAVTADSGILQVNYGNASAEVKIKVFNNLEDTIDEKSIVKNPSAYDSVINKKRNLPSDYVPEDLVPLDDIPKSLQNPEVNQLRKTAYDALKEMFLKAREEKSYELYARSGYRSYKTQIDLYNSYVSNHGQAAADKFSAKPGQSEHQSGLSMDITCASMNFQLDDTFFDKEEGKWVAENAHRFGFIIRYPKGKEDVTGYQYEPWHLRYVGKVLAEEIYKSKLTLEEYFEQ